MNPWYQSDGSDSQLMQLYKIGQSGGRNPYQEEQYQNLLKQAGLAPGSTPTSSTLLDASGQAIQDAIFKLDEKYFAKVKEYNEKNPFVYDDVLKAEIDKAGTRLDPYYKQQLDDYTRGIKLQSQRSVEDMRTTLSNLTADLESYSKENRLALDDALERSRQGFADVGNYFSGAQARATAKAGLEANDQLTDYTRGKEQSMDQARLTNTRNLEDYGLKQKMFERSVGSYDPITGQFKRGADSEAQVRSQAIGEIPAQQAKRNFALQQYVGPAPGVNPNEFYLQTYSGLQ